MPITPRERRRIQQLFALLGSQYAGEREAARARLDELLQKLRLTWNDLPGLLTPSNDAEANTNGSADDDQPAEQSAGIPNALELVHHMLQKFVDLKSPAEYVAIALWALHTHVCDRYLVTPRLAIISPVRGCGKTTLLATLELLAARPLRTDGVTAPALYHLIHAQRRTLLIDEADNADLGRNGPLRAVLNSGHRKGGAITRVIGSAPQQFSTFAPVAIAAIGALPLPILARAVVINMQRSDGAKNLRRLDDADAQADFDTVYRHVFMWAQTAKLNPNPRIPAELRTRAADNWRVLIGIADSFGPYWAGTARDAATALLDGLDEDVGVTLLSDIRDVFDDLRFDRVPSAELVMCLTGLEDANWAEFRGPHGDQSPRALSAGRLASILRPFGIRPRSIWPQGHRDGGGSRKGYLRSQFEAAWARYCPKGGTTAQGNNIRHLRRG